MMLINSIRIVWDEAKLKQNKDQTKGQVFMKIDEPKTPFIRFEQTDKDLEAWETVFRNQRLLDL
ncbi:hypothetical protein BD560DRAFT_389005 [Blakeslea trispora]|nr:hypothetical protein BD560DRAFT_389005 [Blakeslea trispora]